MKLLYRHNVAENDASVAIILVHTHAIGQKYEEAEERGEKMRKMIGNIFEFDDVKVCTDYSKA